MGFFLKMLFGAEWGKEMERKRGDSSSMESLLRAEACSWIWLVALCASQMADMQDCALSKMAHERKDLLFSFWEFINRQRAK